MRLGKIELSFSISVIRQNLPLVAGGELRESRTGPTTEMFKAQAAGRHVTAKSFSNIR